MPKGIPGDYTRYHLRRDREDEPRERAIATPTETGGTLLLPPMRYPSMEVLGSTHMPGLWICVWNP